MTYRKLNDLFFLLKHIVILEVYNSDQRCMLAQVWTRVYLGLLLIWVMVTQKFKEAQSRSALKHRESRYNVRYTSREKFKQNSKTSLSTEHNIYHLKAFAVMTKECTSGLFDYKHTPPVRVHGP